MQHKQGQHSRAPLLGKGALIHVDMSAPWALPLALALISGIVLGIALISEFYGSYLRIFGNQNLIPCNLCILQRYPHALVMVLGLIAALFSAHAVARTGLLCLIALVLISGAYVSGFHIGVEYGWWTAGSTCSTPIVPLDLSQGFVLPVQTPDMPLQPGCSDPAWRFPGARGLSMAGYNFLLSSFLALGASLAALASLQRM